MDEGVEKSEESAVTSRGEFDSEPDAHWHHRVVDDVEGGNVVVFLSKNEENGVEELGELGNVVPPASSGGLQKQ